MRAITTLEIQSKLNFARQPKINNAIQDIATGLIRTTLSQTTSTYDPYETRSEPRPANNTHRRQTLVNGIQRL